MKCIARIPNKWYHLTKFPGTTDHPCPFNAQRDGYCRRHHPATLRPILECKRVRIVTQLAQVNRALAALEPEDGPGNPS